MKKPNNFMWRR